MEFVSLSRVINDMTCYNSSALIGGKFILKNHLQDLLSSLNAVVSTNESTQIYDRSYVIYNPAYTRQDTNSN